MNFHFFCENGKFIHTTQCRLYLVYVRLGFEKARYTVMTKSGGTTLPAEWAVSVTGVMTCHALSRKAREGGQWSVAGSTRPEVETETQQTTIGHLGSCSCDHCQCTVGQYRCWHGQGQYGHKMKLIHMMFTYRTALLTMGWYTDQAQVIF